MGVSLDKVQEQAPHMVSLVKQVGVSLEKKGLNPDLYKAAVVATLDHSGSAKGLYSQGLMQNVMNLGFAAGLLFDDDGEVPVSLFDSGVSELGDMSLGNCVNFVDQHQKYGWGLTDYVKGLRWIVETAGFDPNIGNSGGGGFFRKNSGGGPLSVKGTAPYPTYALFVTDGEPNHGTEDDIRNYLTQMSQLPIFVQFIGVGSNNFKFLESLDDLDGRLIDNANFFDAKSVNNDQNAMLELMLGEFPDYYALARQAGLIVQGAPVPS